MANGDSDINVKIRDLEDRQRLIKDKINLLGNNFVDLKEILEKDLSALKVEAGNMKNEITRIRETLARAIEELDLKAKKSDLEIIAKQLKMFEPMIK